MRVVMLVPVIMLVVVVVVVVVLVFVVVAVVVVVVAVVRMVVAVPAGPRRLGGFGRFTEERLGFLSGMTMVVTVAVVVVVVVIVVVTGRACVRVRRCAWATALSRARTGIAAAPKQQHRADRHEHSNPHHSSPVSNCHST
jgi:uncharacterized membrane protein